jgi:ABC-type branched-subunit amino acid transport system substrate-binding protein
MAARVLDVAFVVPHSGPSGIYGPSCDASGRLAVSEINESGGILGCEVRLRPVDGGRRPDDVAAEVDALVTAGTVDAVIGWHTSAVRQRIAPCLGGRVPYLYTAVYEGGEHTRGVFMTGETPGRQLLPALRWMADEMGVRRWCVVGSDYVWPRASARAARVFAESIGAEIREVIFVGLGTEEFGPVLRRIERSRAQGVLMLLLGSDAVQFNRAFTQMRLPEVCVRLSPLMDENMLLATGAANTEELYSAAGFFESLATAHSMDFERRYVGRLGPNAPAVSSPGESCFEGMTLLAQLAAAAGTTDVPEICRVADSVGYEGPRGRVRLRDRHLVQRIYLAKAEGLEFDVLAEINQGV